MTTYTVHNEAGGTELTTEILDEAVLHALDRCPLGPGYITDESGSRVDLSRWELEVDDDGNAYLVEESAEDAQNDDGARAAGHIVADVD